MRHPDRTGVARRQSFDLGADGILVPCVNTAEDVRLAVSCAKYPVDGPGSEGGTRSIYFNLRPQFPGGFGGLFEYATERGNKETIVMVQIETADALANVEEICQVPGLDVRARPVTRACGIECPAYAHACAARLPG